MHLLAAAVTRFLAAELQTSTEPNSPARLLWSHIAAKFAGRLAAEGAAQEFAEQPDDPDLQQTFEVQLRRALQNDPAFADARVNLVDVRDIAALTGSGHEGQTYAITGPEALTFAEVAARLTAATGRAFTYEQVSEAEFAQILGQWGLPAPVAADLAKEYALIGAGHPAFGVVKDTVQRLTGQPARTVDQFARDYAQALTHPPRWG